MKQAGLFLLILLIATMVRAYDENQVGNFSQLACNSYLGTLRSLQNCNGQTGYMAKGWAIGYLASLERGGKINLNGATNKNILDKVEYYCSHDPGDKSADVTKKTLGQAVTDTSKEYALPIGSGQLTPPNSR